MKIINKQYGIDILQCDDINIMRNILIDSMYDNFKLMEEYGFFLITCYKNNTPLLTAQEWLKIRNNI